jgi:D-alanyl-D-alanine dipeptidase
LQTESYLTVDWRSLPIPISESNSTTTGYHKIAFDTSHALWNDPLVKCAKSGLRCRPIYVQADGLNYPYEQPFLSAIGDVYLRQALVVRLHKVNEALAPYSVELCLLDGYRRIETQREIWNFYCERARRLQPGQPDAEIESHAAHYASDPRTFDITNNESWPVHCTGGAVDLTLVSLDGHEPIYMGGIFDDPSDVSHTSYYENREHVRVDSASCVDSASDEMAIRYRRLLYHAMSSQGFENYPAEWWHYDWGDQMWAERRSLKGPPTRAFFGFIDPP